MSNYKRLENKLNIKGAERHQVINSLIEEYKLINPNYLEIGVQRGLTLSKINSIYKTGVDPNPAGEGIDITDFKISSDEFFNKLNDNIKYDTIFIDGLHECHQVTKDFINSIKHSKEGTLIILDDVNPHSQYEQQTPVSSVQGPCTGDVWKLIFHILPILKSLNVDVNYFEELHHLARGMIVILVNTQLLNYFKMNILDGNIIAENYNYDVHFSSYKNLLNYN